MNNKYLAVRDPRPPHTAMSRQPTETARVTRALRADSEKLKQAIAQVEHNHATLLNTIVCLRADNRALHLRLIDAQVAREEVQSQLN